MEPATLAILLGAMVASSAAAVYTNQQNIKYANQANSESVELANTAHQREVADLKAAGLNPILSASGSGASTPQLKTPGLENPLGDLTSSAQGIARAVNGMQKAELATAEADAVSAKHARDILGRQNMVDQIDQQIHAIESNAKLEALTGNTDPMGRTVVDVDDSPYGFGQRYWHQKSYNDLVEMFRNEIAQGRYLSSVENSVFNDVKGGIGSITGLINSANSWRGTSHAIRQANRESFREVDNFDRHGNYRSSLIERRYFK